jgi:hypothetical protein
MKALGFGAIPKRRAQVQGYELTLTKQLTRQALVHVLVPALEHDGNYRGRYFAENGRARSRTRPKRSTCPPRRSTRTASCRRIAQQVKAYGSYRATGRLTLSGPVRIALGNADRRDDRPARRLDAVSGRDLPPPARLGGRTPTLDELRSRLRLYDVRDSKRIKLTLHGRRVQPPHEQKAVPGRFASFSPQGCGAARLATRPRIHLPQDQGSRRSVRRLRGHQVRETAYGVLTPRRVETGGQDRSQGRFQNDRAALSSSSAGTVTATWTGPIRDVPAVPGFRTVRPRCPRTSPPAGLDSRYGNSDGIYESPRGPIVLGVRLTF